MYIVHLVPEEMGENRKEMRDEKKEGKKKEGEEEEICGGKGNGDVMCSSSSRRTMWLQCTDFHLHKVGWSNQPFLLV